MKNINLTHEQRRHVSDLWKVFGNNGAKHTEANHKYIREILMNGKDFRETTKPTQECVEAIDKALTGGPKGESS